MKKSLKTIAIILLVTIAVACKKETTNPVTPAPSVNGYWTGTVLVTGSPSAQFVGILYNGDGTVRCYTSSADTTMAAKASGTYSIDADSVRTTIYPASEIVKFAAKLNSSNAMIGTMRKETSFFSAIYSISK